MIFLPLFQVKVYPGDESRSPYRSTYCETYVLNAKRGEISVQVHVHGRSNYLLHDQTLCMFLLWLAFYSFYIISVSA